MDGNLRAAVIGVGHLGRFHAQKYAALPGVDLVGVADTDTATAARVAAQCRTAAFTDYRRLLGKVDVVSIVVPTPLHHAVARDFLLAGADVLVEKPITTTLAEADELVALAGEQERILQVGHIERFNPAVRAMHQHITLPLFIEAHRIHRFTPRGTDVDVVLDLMIHDLDLVLALMGSEVSTIHATGVPVATPHTDIANVRLVFADGRAANLTASRISRDTVRRIRIFQPGAFVAVDYAKKELTVLRLASEAQHGSDRGPEYHAVQERFADADALADEISDFIACCRQRRQPLVDGRQGRRALAVALEVTGQIAASMAQIRRSFAGITGPPLIPDGGTGQ